MANGCRDDTAAIAAAFDGVTVLETPVPSKAQALRLGDTVAAGFPRVYVDADVTVRAADVAALVRALRAPGVHAAAPQRRLRTEGVGRLVRWYYDVWAELPHVRSGLFGRGVVAVSSLGFERIVALPPVLSDDLAMSEAFTAAERVVVDDAAVDIRLPRTARDLIRRRVRVATGTIELDRSQLRGADARTSVGTLVALVRARPALLPRVVVFMAITVVARVGARRRARAGDFTTWLRDESSRGTG